MNVDRFAEFLIDFLLDCLVCCGDSRMSVAWWDAANDLLEFLYPPFIDVGCVWEVGVVFDEFSKGNKDFSEVNDFFDIATDVLDFVDLNEVSVLKQYDGAFDLVAGCPDGSFSWSFGFHLRANCDEAIEEEHGRGVDRG